MRTFLKFLALVILVAAVGAVAYGSVLWGRVNEPFKGYDTEQYVQIPQGATTPAIGRQLVERGIVRDQLTFRVALLWSGRSRALKAGEYRFDQPLHAVAVVDRLARGDVHVRRITFPEGLTVREMAALYEARGFGATAEFVAAAQDERLIADLDPDATDLEGYLFPETYEVQTGTPPATLVARMVQGFRAALDDELRRLAAEQGLTTRQVVTLAALVEEETGESDERPRVAAVYRNRMRLGMPMQADPTLIYALQKAGRYDGNIRKTDLGFDSPYNTYKYPGLPPGPIASPGQGSLAAAVRPADVRYLYFVSRNDGTHAFAETLAEHNANVRKFQVEYFREQRRRQGEGDREKGIGLGQRAGPRK